MKDGAIYKVALYAIDVNNLLSAVGLNLIYRKWW